MKWYLGPSPLLMLYHPEPLREFFSNTTTLLNKSGDYDPLEKWLGSGLLISRNEKWHKRRKMLTPAFHFKILDDAQMIFNEQVRTLQAVELVTITNRLSISMVKCFHLIHLMYSTSGRYSNRCVTRRLCKEGSEWH